MAWRIPGTFVPRIDSDGGQVRLHADGVNGETADYEFASEMPDGAPRGR